MGKRHKRTQKRDFRHPRPNVWEPKSTQPRDGWTPVGQRHPDHEEYYKAQKIMDDEEWESFVAVLSKQLPITFRINGSGKFADHLRLKLETNLLADVLKQENLLVDDEPVAPPKSLPWYPHRLAWQLSFSRHQLRRVEALANLHEFIKRETECGAITRQEAVSMVPPLFMDVQPHHKVLDMCAAPGSKTFQLLEMLHHGAGSEGPSGLVVANDADVQRCNMLTHQTKRMCSPALVVTNHPAQFFPLICPTSLPDDAIPKEGELYQFDRILCDVPCSGDGTIRKAPDIWAQWSVHNGNGLHSLQIRITLQAVRLLKVGGRLVYSTCSLNPIEDEAVVAEVLRRSGGSMKLIDVSTQLPQLKRRPGLTHWKVRDRSRWYDNWEEAQDVAYKLDPGMFPQPDVEHMDLPLCMRLLPHDNDTGGFFVAVMEKIGPADDIEFPTYDHRATRKKDLDARDAKREARGRRARESCPAVPTGAGDGMGVAEDGMGVAEDGMGVAEDGMGGAEDGMGGAGSVEDGEADVAAEGPEAQGKDNGTDAAPAPAPAPPMPPPDNGVVDSASGPTPGPPVPSPHPRPKPGGRWHGIDPIYFIRDEDIIQQIIDFYGLDPSKFPIRTHLMTRSMENPTRPKRLYIMAPAVKLLLEEDTKQKLRITCAGLKVFERQEPKEQKSGCAYRLVQEGVPLVLPHITKQLIKLTVQDFLTLITDRTIGIPYTRSASQHTEQMAVEETTLPDTAGNPVPDQSGDLAGDPSPANEGNGTLATDATPRTLEEGGAGVAKEATNKQETDDKQGPNQAANRPEIKRKVSDEQTLENVASTAVGCCVCMIRDVDCERMGLTVGLEAEDALTVAAPLAVATWRGSSSISVLVSKQECAQIAEKLKEALREADGKLPEAPVPEDAADKPAAKRREADAEADAEAGVAVEGHVDKKPKQETAV